MEYRCVQCGFRVKTLFIQYSPGNIRLMKCENCKAVADEYIECELRIVLNDLILHKPKTYRHLLYNVIGQKTTHFQGLLWKACFGCLLLDAYKSSIMERREEEWDTSMSISSFFWIYRKILVDVFLGTFMFLCSFLLAIRNLMTSAQFLRFRYLLLAVLISSYFKIFLVAMMVWDFPPHPRGDRHFPTMECQLHERLICGKGGSLLAFEGDSYQNSSDYRFNHETMCRGLLHCACRKILYNSGL